MNNTKTITVVLLNERLQPTHWIQIPVDQWPPRYIIDRDRLFVSTGSFDREGLMAYEPAASVHCHSLGE